MESRPGPPMAWSIWGAKTLLDQVSNAANWAGSVAAEAKEEGRLILCEVKMERWWWWWWWCVCV